MNAQDWIAAIIALIAFVWLLSRFGALNWLRPRPAHAEPAADMSSSTPAGGCGKCGD